MCATGSWCIALVSLWYVLSDQGMVLCLFVRFIEYQRLFIDTSLLGLNWLYLKVVNCYFVYLYGLHCQQKLATYVVMQ